MRRPALLSLLALALAAPLSACGDDGDRDPRAEATPRTTGVEADAEPASAAVLDHTLPLLDGTEQDLGRYLGRVVLVVNTASECGFAPQFGGLESLHRERGGEGLVVLGFPADDVAGQEPRSDDEIAEFCKANFGVSFPMFSKSNVVSDPVNPLFAELAAELGEPSYNFNKYLIDRRGRPVERFDQSTEPDDPELTAAIEAQLEG
ncbi:MAG: glutathione peroxidase [Actinobacteria bacterium]|nr:glutathione peroxidase [Actinomycetota bacterium]